jgi:23S rRNA (guanosine2251-2'-O)-methyltransferase
VTSSRERNDRNRPGGRPFRKPFSGPRPEAGEWVWGRHAVDAALANPDREIRRLVASPDQAKRLEALRPGVRAEVIPAGEIGRLLPQGAVHQGAALSTPPLEPLSLDELAELGDGLILVLDQVTDPQNVGAILRSAAAFGAQGVILQDRHAPVLAGALAKAAAGAVEQVPHARVVNLSRALEQLADLGWRTVGLAGEAETPLSEAVGGPRVALVLGSEGEGLRRLVSEHCELLARIPMPGGFESLNVSAAAAVALYEASRGRGAPQPGE